MNPTKNVEFSSLLVTEPLVSIGIPAGPANCMVQPQGQLQWTTGLWDCTEDVGNCCMTCWCPCITFGQIAEIVDRGSPSCGASGALYVIIASLTGFQWIYSCTYRSKMRAIYDIGESPCHDGVVHFCCEPCALCQNYRELKNRGFNMQIGWHANMERQGCAPTQPPAVHGNMTR